MYRLGQEEARALGLEGLGECKLGGRRRLHGKEFKEQGTAIIAEAQHNRT